MNELMEPAFVFSSYVVGSVPFASMVAARDGVDLRSAGSGNPGATNVGRLLGKRKGRLVLALDALKGAVPTAISAAMFGLESRAMALVGFAAVLGHCAPIGGLGRGGGKGVATGLGVFSAALPVAAFVFAVTFALARAVSRRASVGSLSAVCVSASAVAVALGWRAPRTSMAIAIATLVWIRHIPNLIRLARGEEPAS